MGSGSHAATRAVRYSRETLGARLRLLMVEDSAEDAELILFEIRRGGYRVEPFRVQTAEELRAALVSATWDLILSDWSMPRFSALEALALVKNTGLDVPFIIVSGTIGEDTAAQALHAGAHDFLLKERLARLLPAIDRLLREAADRHESHARFKTLVESMDDIVYTLDAERRHDGVFGRWVEHFGLTPAHFLGRTTREILGPDAAEAHETAIEAAFSGQQRVLYEWSAPDAAGERFFQTSLSPIRSPEGAVTGVVGVGRDITGQRRLQDQLALSDRMASLGMLAAGVAHEINNPLSALLAHLDLGLRQLRFLQTDEPRPEITEIMGDLGDAREAAARIREIARDLRVFSRGDEEEKRPVDLERVLDSSLRLAENEIRHKAQVVTRYGKAPLVLGNESRLGQLFLNLLVNAAHAIPEGQAEPSEIRVTTSTDARGRATATIEDTGCGMPPEVLRRLFTPFFTTKAIGEGTGLGLTICHRIVEAHGGEISVESKIGVGTIFAVALPAAAEEPSPAAIPRRPRTYAGKRGRILVIDDEPAIVSVMRRFLSAEHEVTGTSDAHAALEMLRAGQRFDVILCDVMMPSLNGMTFYRELASSAPDQAKRVIFLTGDVFNPEVRDFLDGLDNARVEKPFDIATMSALVNERVGS